MSDCKNCGKDVVSKGTKPAQYCSDACRMQYKRTEQETNIANEQTVTGAVSEFMDDQGIGLHGAGPEPLDYCLVDGIKRPLNYGQADCACQHCKGIKMNGLKLTLNHGRYKSRAELAEHERNRVALPWDIDYEGVAQKTA